ncbi:MAG TPA: tRNA (adenosine(37)-N6)-threonylcarbamoyltransferase complex dimerization subunit type 1 TsaB [Candidatus Limnocylindria bacterium]|nr:tRNA (adenosine(37)-N6)-threonylcarbamoyltransferase complex dimerization subunit type 1 TsaB [Candidatus Limnocylindria bacterium]
MLLLALDTATPAVTVAVHDGTRVLAEASVIGARRHGELLAPMIRDVLARVGASVPEVTEVAVGVGPGPFTSLRVGVVTARAFALPGRLPVLGVCSLDALAHEVVADGRWAADLAAGFVVATDAKRREVYWATYGPSGRRLSGPLVDRPSVVAALQAGRRVVGEGARVYPELLGEPLGPAYPGAGALAEVALAALRAGEDAPAVPLYLRRPDAAEPTSSKQVLR